MSLCCENIAARAGELVNPNDVLIVHNLSGSPTLTAFLAAARATRKHRVVLPGAAVFPDGSCLVPAGGLSTCLSAQRHSVPVYVLAAFYKITPFFVPDPMMVNPNKAPGVSFKHSASFCGLVEIPRPTYDHIPASLVTLYVSNSACILPSHVYRYRL
ncbi:hypothetical protein TELCIR_00674 [Teladorsagia circumcincta]|uniref:Translation initiation factor eIF2B subunit beta n=1 Tax=Teladorsagia circumcincta TaxID=45464 RepID=A0A2G9V3Z0_TELCI|nr:hypothetical protein TELCIR_00674 [Teladorsagia circumcincta]